MPDKSAQVLVVVKTHFTDVSDEESLITARAVCVGQLTLSLLSL